MWIIDGQFIKLGGLELENQPLIVPSSGLRQELPVTSGKPQEWGDLESLNGSRASECFPLCLPLTLNGPLTSEMSVFSPRV